MFSSCKILCRQCRAGSASAQAGSERKDAHQELDQPCQNIREEVKGSSVYAEAKSGLAKLAP